MIWVILLFCGTAAFVPFRSDLKQEDLLVKLRDEEKVHPLPTTEEPEFILVEKEKENEKEKVELEKTSLPTTEPPEEEVVVETSEATTEDKSEETHENRDKYTTLVNLKTTDFLTTTEDYDHHNRSRCQDQFSRCYGVSQLCSNKLYEKIMINSCAKTCGFCREFVSLPIPERCRDNYPEECKVWGDNGFCHAYFYTMPEKVENCMKTCGLC